MPAAGVVIYFVEVSSSSPITSLPPFRVNFDYKKEVRKRKKDRGVRYLFAHWLNSDSNPQSPLILVKSLLALSRPRVQLLGPVLNVHGTRTSFACYAGMGCVQRTVLLIMVGYDA